MEDGIGAVKGGMHFYRGSGKGAAKYFEEGHGRAEAYYTEGHQAVVEVGTWQDGERLSSTVLADRGALEAWVEGRGPASGEVKGFIRPGGAERAPLRFVEVVVNNPKSLSVVASQDPVVAAALERVMDRQADEICRYLSTVAVTRTGRRGAQVELGGLQVETARVTHLTSREGDPHRHVHLMLNARVKAPDGTWRGLHSVALRQHIGAINALGHRVLVTDKGLREALASRGYSLGADGEVDQAREAIALMSKRAALVEAAEARVEAAWRAGHPGEEPSRRVAHGWHHQAWEETRRPKPKLKEDPEELSARVRAELAEAGFDFTPGRYRGPLVVAAPSVAQVDRDGLATQVVDGLSAARSAWSGAELTTATERALAASGVVGGAQAVAELAEDLRARAEARCSSILVGDEKVPSVMSRYLTSAAVIDADMALNLGLAGLAATEGPRGTEACLAAREAGLDAGQAEAVAAIAGGAGLEVVIGPAGTGKTAVLAAAQEALEAQGRELVVLAPTRKAAQVASAELGAPATSVAKLLYDYGWRWDDHGLYSRPATLQGPGPVVSGQPAPPGQSPSVPAYEGPGRAPHLSAGSVVVVDEAGLLSVDQAVALIDVVRTSGASLRLVGDPRQLGAVGRGGVMETAARWASEGEVTLSEVHRFLRLEPGPDGLPVTVPDEGWVQVCEQLREGTDPAGTADALLERGAVVVHPSRGEAVAAIAAEAAREAGRDGAVAVTVATNADARELNQAVRALRVAAGQVDDSAIVTGMGRERIGAGDRVVTRRNDNPLGVANRETWTVSAVHPDGSVVVRGKDRYAQLPAEYVRDAVQLGYAATDYGNQGVTAARSATWVSPATSAGGLYVGASRGRWENRLHVVADDAKEAQDVLAAAVRRDRADRGLDAARARAEAEAVRPARDKPRPVVVPEGWRSARELDDALRRVDANLSAALSWQYLRPVADDATWRAETAPERAKADAAWADAARYRAEAARWAQPAARETLLGQAKAEFSRAKDDAWVVAAGPGAFGRKAERVREAQHRLYHLSAYWGTPLPERWGKKDLARAAARAAEARQAHEVGTCEAEGAKAADVARVTDARLARRDGERAEVLASNQAIRERRAGDVAKAEGARAALAEERQRRVKALSPEDVVAFDAARDAERAKVARAQEVKERARQLVPDHLRHRGPDRGGRGLGM
ncbi:MAG TPA: MobF family relaxase [Acidimicrobiales bacterium]|nr:MobF family relaxase [Acidimicrobiales bacterium]